MKKDFGAATEEAPFGADYLKALGTMLHPAIVEDAEILRQMIKDGVLLSEEAWRQRNAAARMEGYGAKPRS